MIYRSEAGDFAEPVTAARAIPLLAEERSSVSWPASDDLPLVMREISSAMSARGTALTIHPDHGEVPRILYTDPDARIGTDVMERLLATSIRCDGGLGDNGHRWISCAVDDRCSDILLVPVALSPGHSRLIITVFFDHLDAGKREEVELVYERRAPFAVGYFRLWQLNRTREKALAAMEAALNLTSMAVMLLDRGGRIAFGNNAAGALLAEGDGLRRINGSVRAARIVDSVRLQVAIDHVIALNAAESDTVVPDRRAPIFSLERSGRSALMVSVLPTTERAVEMHDVAAIVYAMDPSAGVGELLRPVCKVYGLSPAETQLTCNLIAGHTLSEAAAIMHVKEMTVRSYLKQIFIKTNTHRQTELMQLMLSSIIRTSHDIVALPI